MKTRIDILIKGGIIFDGSGSEPFEGDIGIAGDKIAFINRNAELTGKKPEVKAVREIEARDLMVAPGFIDAHAHSEFTLFADPRAEGKICQGITTEINGNCGLSAAPLRGEALKQREEDFREFGIGERWSNFEEYFGMLERKRITLNFVTLVGHGNLRACTAGYENKKLTPSDCGKMHGLLIESIKEGAIGLSTGLIYPPGVYSDTEELICLCKALSQNPCKIPSCPPLPRGSNNKKFTGCGIYTSHMRSEGDRLLESIGETIGIAEESGIRVHISHIKTSGERNWHKIDGALRAMEEARNKGLSVTCDRYPYTAASTDLDTVLPSWAYEGGMEEEIKRLNDKEVRERIGREILREHPEKRYWQNIHISSVSSGDNRWMEGKSVAEIAHQEGTSPVDMLFKILIDEKLRVGAIFSSMSEENLRSFLSLQYSMIGTDSSARSGDGPTFKGKPHPRGFGSFPRFLGRYVRDGSLMSMGEAIRKITLFAAETFRIYKRGFLKNGAFADIVIFDHKKICDRATYSEPFLKPDGINYVIVNGSPAVWEGELTGIRAGRVLRHGR